MELWAFFNSHTHPRVNRITEPAGGWSTQLGGLSFALQALFLPSDSPTQLQTVQFPYRDTWKVFKECGEGRLALVVLKMIEVCCQCCKSKYDSIVIQPAASSVYRLSQTGSGGNIKQVSVRLWTGFSSFREMIQFWAFLMMMADFPVPKHQWILVRLNKYPPALGRQWRAVLWSRFYSAQAATYSVSLTHRYSWIRFTCEQAAWRKFFNLQTANRLSFKLTSRLYIGNPGVRFMACHCAGILTISVVCVCMCVSCGNALQKHGSSYNYLSAVDRRFITANGKVHPDNALSLFLPSIFFLTNHLSRSQWPRGLRCRSAAARLLRSWVRIPPGAWLSISCGCCVLSGRVLCGELITHPEESYWLWCVVGDLATSWMRRHTQSVVIELNRRRCIAGCISYVPLIVTVQHDCWMSGQSAVFWEIKKKNIRY